jgi:POT family proton-dependent oligopeptide transporter
VYLICAVEFYERLASVMVLSLLVLYLNERVGLDSGLSVRIASYLNVLSYAAGMLGGLLADRWIGNRRAALGGLFLLALGYLVLGLAHCTSVGLWAGAALIIAGHGLFKPNFTALLGALYALADPRRTSAFCFFYYALNLGAMLGPVVGGLVLTAVGWGVMFRVAAVCIAAACVLMALGRRYLEHRPAASVFTPQTSRTPPAPTATCNVSGSSRACALALVLAVLAVFGAALSQSYGTLLLWARENTQRALFGYVVPPNFFTALPAAFVLLLGPAVEWSEKALSRFRYVASESGKFTAGLLLCSVAYTLMLTAALAHHDGTPASPLWLVVCTSALALGEILGVPVGLALTETLAPCRSKGLMLGLSYGAHALGYWLGAEVSTLWSRWPHDRFFGMLVLGCLAAAALIHSQSLRFSQALSSKQ